MFPSIKVGLDGWERAHSQGASLGIESGDAIRYAPREVNQAYQNCGIERYLRALFAHRPDGMQIWLTTVTFSHPRTLRLQEMQYRVDAVRHLQQRRLFDASIAVEDAHQHPKIVVTATPLIFADDYHL